MDTCDAVATEGGPTKSFRFCKDPGRSHVFLVDSKAPCSSEGIPRQGRDSWGTWQLDESWSLPENRELSMKNEDLPPEIGILTMKNWVYLIEASNIKS